MSLSLNQFLVLYMWFPLAALLMFIFLIARFFEKFSGVQTYFRAFFVPVVLFGIGAVRYAGTEQIGGDPLGDVMMGIAGLTLLFLCTRLYWVMIVQR